jgi:hypothetical protein
VITGAATALAPPRPAEASLTAVLILATAVWIGGLVAIFMVTRVAHATLGAGERVAFFRDLGRAYGLVGGGALAAALASGAVLASRVPLGRPADRQHGGRAGLVTATVAGMTQARRMTRLRQDALDGTGSAELAAKVRRGRAERRRPAGHHRRAQPGAPGPRNRHRNVTSSPSPQWHKPGPWSLAQAPEQV